MKYVKLVAKPDTWFVPGGEVFDYTEERRITLDLWERSLTDHVIMCRGIRECSEEYELELGCAPYTLRIDGEACFRDEFEVEITEDEGREAFRKMTRYGLTEV